MARASTKRFTYKEFQRFNPNRTPRWRYERAYHLASHVPEPLPPIRGRDDRFVREARLFLLEQIRVTRRVRPDDDLDYQYREIWGTQLPLYMAWVLGTDGRSEKTRCEIEARILARQSDEEIASKAGVLAEAVAWFEPLFFHVRDRLHEPGFITNQILYPGAMAATAADVTLSASAKFFGYFAGPVVLDAVLRQFDSNLPIPKAGETTDLFLSAFSTNTLHRRAAEWAKGCEINRYNVMRLFEINAKLIEIASGTQRSQEALSDLEALVAEFFPQIPWATSERREEALKQSPVGRYLGKTVEPRADELVVITQQTEPVVLPELDSYQDREFPHLQD